MRQTYPTYSCFESSFPRRRESRSVGAETYQVKRFLRSRVLDSHFRGNDGIRFPYG
ncbi:pilus assembly protein PilS [Neisseria gonorrhoeae]|nr:pilus assembly protein PilS [Neisseria gonorrhoeae]